ncbi:MAG: hypothetical protein Q4D82_05005 [Neisseria sp.]|nr:hypothetical protein [Neisseria sp.]
MKPYAIILAAAAAVGLTACNDRQAELEQQLKAQQEQIAKLEAMQDQTVYQLQDEAVNETLSPEAQEKGKNGETVTGNDGQQYMYDPSTGSWLLQSLVGAAAGAFIGNALANKFMKAPANSPAAQQVRSSYAQQYRGKTAKAPGTLNARKSAAQQSAQRQQGAYRPTQKGMSNHQQPRRSRGFGRRR